jgi:hypothetical protein
MKRTLNSSKSHNGCQRCKTKKLKCDETRPSCQACDKDGAECPGYAPTLKWSRKHEKFDSTLGSQEPKAKSRRKENSKPTSVTPQPVSNDDTSASFTQEQRTSPDEDLTTNAAMAHTWPPTQMDFDPAMLDWMDYGFGGFEPFANNNMGQLFNNGTGQTPFMSYDPLAGISGPDNRMVSGGLDPYTFPPLAMPWHSNSGSYASLPEGQTNPPPVNTPNNDDAERKDSGSLLGAFYRLATPTTTARFSEEHLVQHYFSEVCSLYSCFDSAQNPFRRLVADLWKESTTIHLSIQSMAIAHLSNHYLYMAPLGRIKRMQSWKSLQIDLRRYRAGKISLDKVLMSCLLLGLSSVWHQPSDLGLQYLFIARSLIQMYLRSNLRTSVTLPNEKFYLDAFMHWEMLASFFEPVAMMSFPGFGAPNPPMPVRGEIVSPHPWTGVAPELHFALAEVGRVLRRRRSRLAMMGDSYAEERSQKDEMDEQWSRSLERLLQSIRLPEVQDIEDYGDKYTPKMDLLRAAEAYRFVGLLEVYMIVPSLLEARIERGEAFPPSAVEDFTEPSDDLGFLDSRDAWLSAIALHTLNLIKDVSIHSATCRMHLLVLVSAGSQLRTSGGSSSSSSSTPEEPQTAAHHDKVLEGRGFVDSRMLALSRKYPQKQVLQILDIIKEAWDRLDRGEKRVHWLGIAHEMNWQTMLG